MLWRIMKHLSRRGFLQLSAAASLPSLANASADAPFHVHPRRRAVRPAAVGSRNAIESVKIAVEEMGKGVAPVDAAVAGINPVEENPNDTSVGYGGLPNELGVVELDSCVMDGPTGLAGAVASIRNIKNPSKVALKVMRRTDHVLLVGQGALNFAKAHGFVEEDLLTDRARESWLRWKENLSDSDDWIGPAGNRRRRREEDQEDPEEPRQTGTIHVSAINESADLGACTSTSGLAYKVPGRVGDSPLIGCGLYTDNDFGSAGSTGRGEAVILSNGSSFIVHQMATGKSPVDACLEACRRIARMTKIPRLLNANGRPNFQVNFYAVNKAGVTGGAAIYPSRYAALTENGNETLDSAYLHAER